MYRIVITNEDNDEVLLEKSADVIVGAYSNGTNIGNIGNFTYVKSHPINVFVTCKSCQDAIDDTINTLPAPANFLFSQIKDLSKDDIHKLAKDLPNE
jgi:hypothetical protein